MGCRLDVPASRRLSSIEQDTLLPSLRYNPDCLSVTGKRQSPSGKIDGSRNSREKYKTCLECRWVRGLWPLSTLSHCKAAVPCNNIALSSTFLLSSFNKGAWEEGGKGSTDREPGGRSWVPSTRKETMSAAPLSCSQTYSQKHFLHVIELRYHSRSTDEERL